MTDKKEDFLETNAKAIDKIFDGVKKLVTKSTLPADGSDATEETKKSFKLWLLYAFGRALGVETDSDTDSDAESAESEEEGEVIMEEEESEEDDSEGSLVEFVVDEADSPDVIMEDSEEETSTLTEDSYETDIEEELGSDPDSEEGEMDADDSLDEAIERGDFDVTPAEERKWMLKKLQEQEKASKKKQ